MTRYYVTTDDARGYRLPAAVEQATRDALALDAASVDLRSEAYRELLTDGEPIMPRSLVTSSVAGATGGLRLAGFTARRSQTVTKLRTYVTAAQSGTAPTLARLGLYSVNADGGLTLLGATANAPTLGATAGLVTLPLAAGVAVVAGQRYAVGHLVVTAGTVPTFAAQSLTIPLETIKAPMLTAWVASQADLPATIAATALGNTSTRFYSVLVP